MDGVTQHNASMVDQATAASRTLASYADQLAAQVGRFQLPAGGSAVGVVVQGHFGAGRAA